MAAPAVHVPPSGSSFWYCFDTGERALLRLVTPLTKLVTGKQAVAVISEVIEGFGGAGYVEDTGLPQLLRDTQVLLDHTGDRRGLAAALRYSRVPVDLMHEVDPELDRVLLGPG